MKLLKFMLFFILLFSFVEIVHAQGLVASYGFNESSGSTTADSSGNGNTGTILSATRITTGKFGRALAFNGLNTWVTINNASVLSMNSSLTLEAWVYPNVTSLGWRTIIAKEGVSSLDYYLYASNKHGNYPAGGINNGTEQDIYGTTAIPINQWTHLALTYNGSVEKYYMNGNLVSTVIAPGGIKTSGGRLRIGGNNIYGEYFIGWIDEVKIYDTALTQNQISQDMNLYVGGPILDIINPLVKITSPLNNASVFGLINITANASDNKNVTKVEFYDGALLIATDSSVPYNIQWNATSAGIHQLKAIAYDAANNTAQDIVTVSVGDIIPPTISVSSSPVNPRNVDTVMINASASDSGGISSITIYLDGNPVMNCSSSQCAYSSQLSAGQHNYYATAKDNSLNSASTSIYNITVSYYDNVAPNVFIVSPLNSSIVSGVVNISANASDDVGVVGVSFFVNGVQLGSEDVSVPYSMLWNTSAYVNGTYNLSAKARDAAGNNATAFAIVTVDNYIPDITPPSVSVIASPANPTDLDTVVFNATASDASGISTLSIYLDGSLVASCITSQCIYSSQLSLGQHNYYAIAFDNNLNNASTQAFNLTVSHLDLIAPNVFITSPLNSSVVSGVVNISANASDDVGVVGVSFFVNGVQLGSEDVSVPYSMLWNTSAYVNGTYNLSAKARDAAGNNATAYAVVIVDNYIPDMTPPIVSITSPVNASNVSGMVIIAANASDNIGVSTVEFFSGAVSLGVDTTSPYSISWNTTLVPNGLYNITAVAKDAANNSATSIPVMINVKNVANNSTFIPKIMPLGDSITAGDGDTRGGYRSQLYYILNKAGYNFSFVGRSTVDHDPPVNFTFPSAYWYHEGYNSATIDNSGSAYVWNQNIAGCLAANMPDIMLVMLGTNDIWSTIRNSTQVRNEMSSFLDQIWAINPNIKVILSTIPYETADAGNLVIIQQTNALWPALVAQKQAQGRYITLVDNYAATKAANSFADGIHPDTVGDIAIANAWYPAIVAAINNGTIADTVSPIVSITAPANSSNVSGSVNITANATDNVAVSTVQFLVDGVVVATDSSAPYIAVFNSALYINGLHNITVIANDTSSNTASAQIVVNINNVLADTTPPTVSITSPVNGSVVNSTINITANASDNVGVARVDFYADANLVGSSINIPYVSTLNTSSLTNGMHLLSAKAQDTSNNTAWSINVSINVSNSNVSNVSYVPFIGNYVPPLRPSFNKRYIVDQNNKPFLLQGDAAWSMIAQLNRSDADIYLANRSANGFNIVMVNLIEHMFATNAPADIYNNKPFTGTTFTTPNEAYFANADYMIKSASSKGIIVMLDPLYLGYSCGSQGWCAEVQSASTSDMYSWGQYVGNRYKNYDNIVWLIGADTDPTPVKANVQAMVDGILSVDTRHAFTAHNEPESMAIDHWGNVTWLNINDFYTYSTSLYSNAQSAYAVSPTMPFFLIESAYENEHSSTQVQLRSQAYWTVLSGGIGQMFGNCPMWEFDSSNYCGVTGWKSQLLSQGSLNMKYFGLLFNSRAWQLLVPDTNHSVVTAGYGSGINYVATALASDGSTMISYLPASTTLTVNMAKISGNSSMAWWYNPSNGQATLIGTYSNSGSQAFTSSSGDWVLVIDNAALNYSAPGGANYTIPPDTTPPSVAVTRNIASPNSSQQVIFNVSASDASGISGIWLFVNNSLAKNCSTSPCIYTAGPWANGTNISYFANASDIYNNTARSPSTGVYSFVVIDPVSQSNQTNQSNQTTQDLIVYQDNLVSPWTTDGTYGGTYTVQSNVRPYTGNYSIYAASNAWGLLSLKEGTYWTTLNSSGKNYTALRFALFVNNTPVLLRISLGYANSTANGIVTDWGYVQQTYSAGSWQIVTLNMTQLNPNKAIFNTIEFWTYQGTAAKYYLDDIKFVGS